MSACRFRLFSTLSISLSSVKRMGTRTCPRLDRRQISVSNRITQNVYLLGAFAVSGAILLVPVTYIFDEVFTEICRFSTRDLILLSSVLSAILAGSLLAFYFRASLRLLRWLTQITHERQQALDSSHRNPLKLDRLRTRHLSPFRPFLGRFLSRRWPMIFTGYLLRRATKFWQLR